MLTFAPRTTHSTTSNALRAIFLLHPIAMGRLADLELDCLTE